MPPHDWTSATGRLPFASEVFGTYRPMVGWASRRKRERALRGRNLVLPSIVREMLEHYRSGNQPYLNSDHIWVMETTKVGHPGPGLSLFPDLAEQGSFLLPSLRRQLTDELGPDVEIPPERWADILDPGRIERAYGDPTEGAVREWQDWRQTFIREAEEEARRAPTEPGPNVVQAALEAASRHTIEVLDQDSRLAAALADLARTEVGQRSLAQLFGSGGQRALDIDALASLVHDRTEDPFLHMDPRDQLNGVSISPLGIVHYFRQFFFELDTFLGSPVGHVWLSPGSTVELVESSTRRSLVEKTVETETETHTQAESTATSKDDLTQAIKEQNQQDTKLGFSTTVNQSWPAGSATATGSINLDTTQQMARETTHQRLREQTQKISEELRNQFRTTFKTVTETTDVSSRRYVISNPSETSLQNYELRRKMRQVVVQVQDIGTYLCWETFIDDPGSGLGLANLVHVAKPPEATPVQNPALIPVPERKAGIPFDVKVIWHGMDKRQSAVTPGIPLGRREVTVDIPDGYELEMRPGDVFQLECLSATGDDPGDFRNYQYLARYIGDRSVDVFLGWGTPGGLRWTHTVQLDLRGTVALVPSADRLLEIKEANTAALESARSAAETENAQKRDAALIEAARERVTLASGIKARKFEDLREEERTVVYRALIEDLMAGDQQGGRNYRTVTPVQRHVFATVLDAIFDIDRMLYFAAPEWWKPRRRSSLMLGEQAYPFGPDKVVAWSRSHRADDYYITDTSVPARLGSSLGWVLQLDGDDLRNRFLNAPWVRAVLPVRPGKEEAAFEWLSRAAVEGTDGLDARYVAEDGEAQEITDGLAGTKTPAASPPTIRDAIRYLARRVGDKHQESMKPRLFPESPEVDEAERISATPLDRVYEHGFYPLQGSFRARPLEDAGPGEGTNFQIVGQWLEVVPTDQVVPVVVDYDPVTGRLRRDDN